MAYVFSSLGDLGTSAQSYRQQADCLDKRASDIEGWARCGGVLLSDVRRWQREATTLREQANSKRRKADELDAQVAARSQGTVDRINRLRQDADLLDQQAADYEAWASRSTLVRDIRNWQNQAARLREQAARKRSEADRLEAAL